MLQRRRKNKRREGIKKMRKGDEEEEKNKGSWRLAVEDDRRVVLMFTDGILDY